MFLVQQTPRLVPIMSEDNEPQVGGQDYKKDETHSMVLFRYQPSETSETIVPNFEHFPDMLKDKISQNASVSPEVVTESLAPEYNAQYEIDSKGITKPEKSNIISLRKIAKNKFPEDIHRQDLFIARSQADAEFGVFSDWNGMGATKYIPHSATDGEPLIDQKYGAPEYYIFEREPKTLSELDADISYLKDI